MMTLSSKSNLSTFGACVAFMMLAACSNGGSSTPPLSSGQLAKQRIPVPFTLIYSFQGAPNDGQFPVVGLTVSPKVSDVFYGTTRAGGTAGVGTVFVVDSSSGKEGVLYSFTGKDGKYPESALTFMDGSFYGTTSQGGPSDTGTVYEIRFDGTERVVHGFTGKDGHAPSGDLVPLKGALYGTTELGGPVVNGGVVFEVQPKDGAETILHDFKGPPDGAFPESGLTLVDGALYGTTRDGGANDLGCVFKVVGATENVLYSFKGGGDGAHPAAGITVLNNTLYGVTQFGGANGDGTVFRLNKDGTAEQVIYSFNGKDGARPVTALQVLNDKLYGTAYIGGAGGAGTVFEIDQKGTLRVLQNFSGPDGRGPRGLTGYGTTELFGTTESGGKSKLGLGTVFEVVP